MFNRNFNFVKKHFFKHFKKYILKTIKKGLPKGSKKSSKSFVIIVFLICFLFFTYFLFLKKENYVQDISIENSNIVPKNILFTASNLQLSHISDGDTLTVYYQNKKRKVRLYGLDAPELKQKYGLEAKNYLAAVIKSQKLNLYVLDVDKYGRLVAEVTTANGLNLNQALLANGYGWVYSQHCLEEEVCQKYFILEKQAQENKLGLWAEEKPIAPWKWRNKNKITG